MKSMKPFLSLLLLGILCLHRATAQEPVTIAFTNPLEHESEFVRALAGIEGIHALESKVCGKITGRRYELDLIQVVDGKPKQLLPLDDLVCESDTLRFYMICKSVGADSAQIVLRSPLMTSCNLRISRADGCVALETFPEKELTTSDSIAVLSFSHGEPIEIPLPDGKIFRGEHYCSVRDGRIHPSKWHRQFKLDDYIYFQIRFTDER